MGEGSRLPRIPIIRILLGHRFVKFGTIGFSGTAVNLGVLYLFNEIFFRGIYSPMPRLTLSLSLAIFLATLNNFMWNRIWTWGDRRDQIKKNVFVQMGQYFVACWSSIGLQFVFTVIFSHFIHYLVANMVAIALAAVINYVINDLWTFAIRNQRSIN